MQSVIVGSLLICWIATAVGQEFVFDIPTVVHHSTNHSMIVTMLKSTESDDRLEYVSLSVSAVNGAEFFNLQKEYLWDGNDQISNAITFSLTPSHHQCHPINEDDSESSIFCRCLVRATARSEFGIEKVVEKEVKLMKKRGHIFIQTDRPVYRPNDKVHVRFIPVDSQLRSLQNVRMQMEISPSLKTKHAHKVKALKERRPARTPSYWKEFHIPDTPLYGKWTISASFRRDYMEDEVFQSSFFVERYDLPAFEVKVIPASQGFIVDDDESFQFVIVATYPYGKPVSGSVHVRIGLEHHLYDNSAQFPHYIDDMLLDNGKATLDVELTNFLNFRDELNNQKIQIEASVVDDTGMTRTVIDDSFVYTSNPITLQFTDAPPSYKPGLTYQFRILARFVNGSTANNVDLHVTRGDDAEPLVIVTNSEGLALGRVSMPSSPANVDLSVTVNFRSSHGNLFPTSITTNIQPEISSPGAYLKLLTPLQDFAVGESSCVDIEVSPTEHDLTIYYFVMNGDEQLLHQGSVMITSESQNKARVLIPILADMSPRSHLTAYYKIPQSIGDERIVMDSVKLFVQRACHGTEPSISVHAGSETTNRLPKPGEDVELYLTVGRATYIGISGVDSASLLLRTESHDHFDEGLQAVGSRDNFFEVMKSMDVSNRSADVTSRLGRSNLGDVVHRRSARHPRVDDGSLNRNRRSMDDEQRQILGVCCEVGKTDLSILYMKPSSIPACGERSKTVDDDRTVPGCREEFFRCCCQRDPDDETCTLGIRSVHPFSARPAVRRLRPSEVTMIDSPRKVRRNFAHTWFNLDFENRNLSPYTMLSTTGTPAIPSLPHTITSWSLNMFTISEDNTLCIGKPFQFPVEHNLYMKLLMPEDGVSVGERFFIEVLIFNHGHVERNVGITLLHTDGICSEASVNRDRSEEKLITLAPAENGVASVHTVRLALLPYESGRFDITVQMHAPELGWTDEIIKTVETINKNKIEEIHWIQIQNIRQRGGRSSRQLSDNKLINFTISELIVPGSYKVSLVYHSISSASLRGVTISEADKAGIDQYLYRLRNAVSRYNYLNNKGLTTEENLKELKDHAQFSWNGVLTYIRNERKHQDPELNAYEGVGSPEYLGFSYSPSETAQPDLWLTCVTLRLLVESRDLVPLDQDILMKVLHWILLHYNSEDGRFCKCSSQQHSNLTAEAERKELYNQIYQTSIVLSELNRIYEVYQSVGSVDTLSFITPSNTTLHSILRRSTKFVNRYARSIIISTPEFFKLGSAKIFEQNCG